MATLALIYVSPVLERKLKFLPARFGFRDVVVSTIATQIFVLPLLLSMSGKFSVVALPVNVLILGATPSTMLFGFLCGAVGLFFTILAVPFGFVAYALLHYELKVVEIFASLPFATLSLPVLSGLSTVVIGLTNWHRRNGGAKIFASGKEIKTAPH
ncbi:MAG: ComEC/Rec2 family competence protein [Candidatus Taylorbacteria bacterium]|nr:ComEC/Rec2 family competence protein [Candidatus Taylorbacteria bacterium]